MYLEEFKSPLPDGRTECMAKCSVVDWQHHKPSYLQIFGRTETFLQCPIIRIYDDIFLCFNPNLLLFCECVLRDNGGNGEWRPFSFKAFVRKYLPPSDCIMWYTFFAMRMSSFRYSMPMVFICEGLCDVGISTNHGCRFKKKEKIPHTQSKI